MHKYSLSVDVTLRFYDVFFSFLFFFVGKAGTSGNACPSFVYYGGVDIRSPAIPKPYLFTSLVASGISKMSLAGNE